MTAAPLLLHVFSTFAVGGPQVRFAAVANRFGRRWRHAVVAMDGNLAARERLAPGLDVAFPTLALRPGDTLGNLRRIRAALSHWRPDAMVTSNWGTIEWGLANALPPLRPIVPHIHMEDGFGAEERAGQLPRRVWTRRLALRRARVVVPSSGLRTIATRVWRLPGGRVSLVPNGIDVARFAQPARESCAGEVVIGSVAALRPEKNLARLIDAFARLDPALAARLVIVGDGPERGTLAARVAAAGLAGRVRLAGHRADPSGAYAGFDVFALSSDTEQMPLSVLEAMAAGLPVAATDVGDVAAMLAAENRPWVVAPGVAALAGALDALVRDPALRARLGVANQAAAAARFGQETMFAAHAALWDGAARPSTRANTSSWPALVSSQPNRSA